MAAISLPHPLPVEQIPLLMEALSKSQSVDVGQVTFSADEDATVWGTDPYGCDFIAANSLDADKIITAADRLHDPSMRHPAEFSY